MKHRIFKACMTDDFNIDITFYTGEVKRFDFKRFAAYERQFEVILEDGNTAGNIYVGKDNLNISWNIHGTDYVIKSDALWDDGVLIERVNVDDVKMRLARHLLLLRDSVGITQKELAALSSVHQADISNIERGLANPSIETVEKLVRVMNRHLDFDLKTQEEMDDELIVPGNLAMYLASWKRQGDYTVRDIMELPEGVHAELIDGVIYDMASPSTEHQRVAGNLYFQFRKYIESRKGNCEVFIAGIGVVMEDNDKYFFEPDMTVSCNPDNIGNHIITAPDLVLEITSPSNASRDYSLKASAYRKMGVREYWLIDLQREYLIIHDYISNIEEIHRFDETVGVKIYDGDLKIDLREMIPVLTM